MTLTVALPEEEIAGLAAKARAQGVTAEQYARLVLQHLPKDGASEHNYYIYGLPKRNM